MHGEAVKDQHIARVNFAANPIAAQRRTLRNFWDVEVVMDMALNAKAVRSFQNLQRAQSCRAVVKGNPGGKALRISIHESEVLMRMIHETFATRENQPAYRFWMNQDILSNELAHNLFQGGMVRQGVKRFQIEYCLVDSLEGGVWISARRADVSHAIERVVVAHQPASRVEDARYVAKHLAESLLGQ
jgi:hypothetical protein